NDVKLPFERAHVAAGATRGHSAAGRSFHPKNMRAGDHASAEGKTIAGIKDQAQEALLAYHWPGDIHEIENVIERNVILTESGDKIDWPFANYGPPFAPAAVAAPAAEARVISESNIALEVISGAIRIRDIEAKVIELAVKRSNGNLSEAARLIGISRRQLAY